MDSNDNVIGPPAPSADVCRQCGEQVDPAWRFCDYCGAADPAGDRAPSTATHVGDDQGIHPLPGYDPDAVQASMLRRNRRKRQPLYRRKVVFLPSLALLCLVIVLGGMVYQANSLMSSLQSVSTPPPVITDSTYIEGEDPDMPGGPISVETGPAQEALADTAEERDILANASSDGFTARLQGITSGIGDVAGGAAVASGFRDGSDEGFTVLLMGVDAQPGAAIDIGVRPDVLMLIRFDAETKTCRMLSIPRDTRVELPGYGESKINHALMVGGIPYQLLVTEDFIGQPVDHYVLVDFEAFKQAVNVVGGVEVTLPEDLRKGGELRYTAGAHEFDGEEALAYSRFRTASDDGDLGRVARQWSLFAGLADAAQGRDLITDVNTLVPMVEDHIRTELTLTEMATIARDYGDPCLSVGEGSIAMVRGTRVQFNDPILDQVVYYNVVADGTVEKLVGDLISGTGNETITVAADLLATIAMRANDESRTTLENDTATLY